jgi:hypothetical protein
MGSLAEVARAFEVNLNVLHCWRPEFRQGPGNAFPSLGKRRWEEGRGRPTRAQNRSPDAADRFLEGVLAAHRRAAEAEGLKWTPAVYAQIQTQANGNRGLTVKRMCKLARLSRAGLYRFRTARCPRSLAGCHPAPRAGVSQLRLATHHRRTPAAEVGGESQARLPLDAQRITCCVCGKGSSWSPPTPPTACRSISTWRVG